MIASPHFAQIRLVRWFASSRFASEARAVFDSSPFLGIDSNPFRLSSVYLDFSVVLAYLMNYASPYSVTIVYHSREGVSNQGKVHQGFQKST